MPQIPNFPQMVDNATRIHSKAFACQIGMTTGRERYKTTEGNYRARFSKLTA